MRISHEDHGNTALVALAGDFDQIKGGFNDTTTSHALKTKNAPYSTNSLLNKFL